MEAQVRKPDRKKILKTHSLVFQLSFIYVAPIHKNHLDS